MVLRQIRFTLKRYLNGCGSRLSREYNVGGRIVSSTTEQQLILQLLCENCIVECKVPSFVDWEVWLDRVATALAWSYLTGLFCLGNVKDWVLYNRKPLTFDELTAAITNGVQLIDNEFVSKWAEAGNLKAAEIFEQWRSSFRKLNYYPNMNCSDVFVVFE